MDKPTVFFSHTSRDKESVLHIQKRINEITGNSINIFMSSDGQSIPFGTNWVHRVEEGLASASIMFVFVTPISIRSGWIYFEAGYAYSKGIEVIPVGINTDIGTLRAPLSLLQGFNIASTDSLNNFISIINKKYKCTFSEDFTEEDFQQVIRLNDKEEMQVFPIGDYFSYANFAIDSEYNRSDGTKKEFDLETIFQTIIEHLESNGIQYSKAHNSFADSNQKEIITNGIRIRYRPKPKETDNQNAATRRGEIMFRLSACSFAHSFKTFVNIVESFFPQYDDNYYIDLHLAKDAHCLIKDEDASSIISQHTDLFEIHKESSNGYTYKPNGLRFGFFDNSEFSSRAHDTKKTDHVVYICFNKDEAKSTYIDEVIEKLVSLRLLWKDTSYD